MQTLGVGSIPINDLASSKSRIRQDRLAAEQGNREARGNLGFLYQQGLGVTRDYAQALHFYELSAAQGYYYAQRNLGYLYRYGLGVQRNTQQALHWYRQAAEQGDAPSVQAVVELEAADDQQRAGSQDSKRRVAPTGGDA